MKRLFFALWPDASIRKQCVKIMQGLDNGRGRTVNPNNLHVTLVFLGHVAAEKELLLKQEAGLICIPRISICFNQISFWKKPGILCLTASEVNQELIVLVDQLTSIAVKLAIRLDDQPFNPHVTLFRKVNGITPCEFDTIDWQSSSFCLVESNSQLNNVEYRVLECWEAR